MNTWNWEKLGLIFQPDRSKWWMQSHASLPVPVHIGESRYRVYFASRDQENRSHIGFFEVELEDSIRIQAVSEEPVLAPGPLGHFDDHGIYAASAVRTGTTIYLYTIGWNPGSRPPLFYATIGLAISTDGGITFEKYGQAPIMARSDHDPCLVTSPFVLFEGHRWRMWYVSGYRWEMQGDTPQSHYHIKYAESEDGVHWERDGQISIEHASPEEKNIARSSVLRDGSSYRAWYSYNSGEGYRIGYGESEDGKCFTRMDDRAGIGLSAEGWDSEALAYPYVIRQGSDYFMFYNGNGFGRDGIGLARCKG